MLRIISSGALILLIGGLVALCIRSLIREHKRGERCECIGDCSKCKIHCQSNLNYYGLQPQAKPENGSGERESEALR